MPSFTKEKKVDLNFTNWILGGSLVSVSSTENTKRGAKTRRVVVEVDSDGEEIIVKPSPMKHVKRKVSEAETAKTEESKKTEATEPQKETPNKDEKTEKKDDKTEKKEKPKKCHHCPDCGEKMTKKEGKKDDKTVDDKKGDEKKDEPKKTEKKNGDDKSGEKKDDNGGGNGGSMENNKGWTEAQDAKIKEMKADNKSWKEIALEVGASKKDVTHRFKELHNASEGEKKADDGRAGTAEDPFIVGCEDLFTAEISGGNGEGENKNNAPKEEEQSKNGHQEKGQKHQNNGVSNWDFTPNENGAWTQEPQSPQQTQKQSPKYNHEPGYGKSWRGLRADAVWTVADCECLEQLEQRYRVNKWLHLQADFYNWTGRMVSAELIERKFRDDGY